MMIRQAHRDDIELIERHDEYEYPYGNRISDDH